MTTWCLGLLSLVVAACGNVVPAAALNYASRTKLMDPQERQVSYDELPADKRGDIATLHQEVARIIGLPTLRVFLEDADALLAKPSADPISGGRFAAIYLGRMPSYAPARLCYRFQEGGGSETAATGLSSTRSACNRDQQTVADVTLRSITYQRAHSTTLEEKACAVNTLAHEWTHAIMHKEPQGLQMVFEDGDHDHQAGAVASYTIGAFAQCLYLADANGKEGFDVRRCVEAVGTNAFRPAACASGWAAQFAPRKNP
jgi:hypothetical protein